MESLDRYDRRLLELLQVNSRQTGKQLSEKMGLSPAACLRRVQRLRRIGAIEREIAVIARKFREPSVTIIALLTVAREDPQRIDLLKKRLRSLPEVEKIYHVTGEADIALTVSCSSMEAYAAFTEAHFYEPNIKGFDSLVVLREYSRE